MEKQEYDDETLTRYLLGALDEETTELLDELSICDDDIAARLHMLETDLVDAYVRGELPGSTLTQFESVSLRSPKRRERVSFARSLRAFEGRAAAILVTDSERTNASTSVRPARYQPERASGLGFFTGRRLAWGFVASTLLLFVVGGYLTVENVRLRSQISETHARRAELEQRERELEKQLTDQRASDADAVKELALVRDRLRQLEQRLAADRPGSLKIVALTLSPQTRGINQVKPLVLPTGTDYVAVSLELEATDFPAYRASLKTPASGQTIWNSGKLVTGGAQLLRLRWPASLLRPQNYILELSGVSANGASEIIGGYAFKVVIQ